MNYEKFFNFFLYGLEDHMFEIYSNERTTAEGYSVVHLEAVIGQLYGDDCAYWTVVLDDNGNVIGDGRTEEEAVDSINKKKEEKKMDSIFLIVLKTLKHYIDAFKDPSVALMENSFVRIEIVPCCVMYGGKVDSVQKFWRIEFVYGPHKERIGGLSEFIFADLGECRAQAIKDLTSVYHDLKGDHENEEYDSWFVVPDFQIETILERF